MHKQPEVGSLLVGLTERQFQIKVEAAPGAPTAVFHWRAVTTGTQTLSDTSP